MNKLPKATFFDIALLLFDYRERYLVKGDSMFPLLSEGEQVVVEKGAKVKAGDIVIAQHPFKKSIEMIKRIREIDENGNYFLISDNLEESQDSRTFGAVSIEYIKGKVISRL